MSRAFILIAVVALTACDAGELQWHQAPEDPEVQQYVFERCLTATRGPERTVYNDWDEAIYACSGQASGAARYCPDGAKCSGPVSSTRADVRAILPKEPRP